MDVIRKNSVSSPLTRYRRKRKRENDDVALWENASCCRYVVMRSPPSFLTCPSMKGTARDSTSSVTRAPVVCLLRGRWVWRDVSPCMVCGGLASHWPAFPSRDQRDATSSLIGGYASVGWVHPFLHVNDTQHSTRPLRRRRTASLLLPSTGNPWLWIRGMDVYLLQSSGIPPYPSVCLESRLTPDVHRLKRDIEPLSLHLLP